MAKAKKLVPAHMADIGETVINNQVLAKYPPGAHARVAELAATLMSVLDGYQVSLLVTPGEPGSGILTVEAHLLADFNSGTDEDTADRALSGFVYGLQFCGSAVGSTELADGYEFTIRDEEG